MKHVRRIAWNTLVAMSALLFAVTLYGASRDRRLTFFWHGSAELAWHDGRLWLDNQPQLKMEAARAAAVARQMSEADAQHEAAARRILHNEPWGSPAYRKALDDLNHRRDMEAADRSREQAAQAAAATRRVEHSISIGLLLSILACAPVIWILFAMLRRLRLPPVGQGGVRRPRQLNLLAAAAVVSVMLFVATSALWIRSLMVSDEMIYIAHSPARLAVTSLQLRAVKDTVQFWRTERVFGDRRGYDLADPGSATNVFTAKDDLLFETPGLKYRTRPPIGLWGFHFEHTFWLRSPTGTVTTKGSNLLVSLPLWVFLLIWMVAPTFWMRRRLRIIRNAGRSLCASCGYDLRETPGRCPECGTVPAVQPKGTP